ncbi:Fasciclin-like arabinogalactan family protein [Perilla frutescens var. hirtella]|uniref:Fasciclin-like arabinogalactan family protein n=1 Tax=Perilla frutescens var. hirtella TaxID=608512 RepID=A0AAD4J7R4_PERFH|nr:Fasciclin-like arabinogalactan family protein [Perilla frutescens var. hirtella]KAH6810950.1 Fasciclin-like arabinogalactan family protein [Perilla frutescens var. frutescens]KAH6828381.1 Fasciclin-like arabinogalactan family protein [Perilla frutescens var. hirtella]
MAISISISIFTPLTFLYLLLLSNLPPILSLNITDLLSAYPDLSDFTSLLTTTAVAADLSPRTSVTILAVPNAYLRSPSADFRPSSTNIADVLRYHVLLEYLSSSDLRRIPPTGKLVTTLFQTTGRAAANSGSINITFDVSSTTVTFHSPASNATMLSLIKTLPYNISILTLNSLLNPYNLDLMASETRPPPGLNITKALIDGHNFNVAASMLAASGVVSEFEADEGGAGITLFVPTDAAFADLPSSVKLQSLPADKKAVVLRFHVLHSYYPLGSLESIVNPIYPTLATEQNGAGSFTVNISRVNDSVAIDTGIVLASVTQTVFDQNPVAIFGVSKVLLPREFFGKNPIDTDKPSDGGGVMAAAQPPYIALSPDSPSHLSAPPGLELRSAAAMEAVCFFRILLCIVLSCLLL